MIPIILTVIFFAWFLYWCRSQPEYTEPFGASVIMCALMSSMVYLLAVIICGTGVVIYCYFSPRIITQSSYKKDLVAIKTKDTTELNGQFSYFLFMGGGSIQSKEESYYRYYVNNVHGIQMEQQNAFNKNLYIQERNDLPKDVAYIEEHWETVTWKYQDILHKYFDSPLNWMVPSSYKTHEVINVPTGTIKKEIQISL